jgi:hypothetical protein
MTRAAFKEIVDGGTVITYSVWGSNAMNFADIDGLIVVGMAYADGWFRTYRSGFPDLNIDMVVPSRDISRLNQGSCAIGEGNKCPHDTYLCHHRHILLTTSELRPIN